MAGSPVFECVCEVLERSSSLDRLESRGTVRLALKQAGLEARSVSASQMKVVLEKVLPEELASRGVDDVDALLGETVSALATVESGVQHDSPESVFARLGG
ncbi:MAG: hypothetical protein JRG80_06625 [Deltaproteobacteria bacterium]|nr:hypothetical protein [Deltaproteobacteria bacterium]MBW2665132.1 hypothetical protein [Deltaproteobacteria bacterium]